MKRLLISTLLVAASFLSMDVMAAGDHDMAKMAADAPAAMVNGTVKKVDKAAGEVILAHGELTNLGMPAMTMAFRVKDNAWLGQMKKGEKIRFMADMVNGAVTVVHFEPVK